MNLKSQTNCTVANYTSCSFSWFILASYNQGFSTQTWLTALARLPGPISPWVLMRNFSTVSEMRKGPKKRNKIISTTVAPIIALATLKAISMQLNGKLMMSKIYRQCKTIPSERPEFIPLSSR